MRNVTIFSTVGEVDVRHASSALTWGDLKKELDQMNFTDKTVAILETETVLVSSTSTLPTGDFTLIITPTKNKAGNYDNLSYSDLIAVAHSRGYSNISSLTEDELRHLIQYGTSGVFPVLSRLQSINEKLEGLKNISFDVMEELDGLVSEMEEVLSGIRPVTTEKTVESENLKKRVQDFINKLP